MCGFTLVLTELTHKPPLCLLVNSGFVWEDELGSTRRRGRKRGTLSSLGQHAADFLGRGSSFSWIIWLGLFCAQHVRIRIHVVKTQVWNAAADGDLLEDRTSFRSRGEGVEGIWSAEEQGVRILDTPLGHPNHVQAFLRTVAEHEVLLVPHTIGGGCPVRVHGRVWNQSGSRSCKAWWMADTFARSFRHFWPRPLLAQTTFWLFPVCATVGPRRVGPRRKSITPGPEGCSPKGGSRRQGDHDHVDLVEDPSQRRPDGNVVQWLCWERTNPDAAGLVETLMKARSQATKPVGEMLDKTLLSRG